MTDDRQRRSTTRSGIPSGYPRWPFAAVAGVALAVVLTSGAVAMPATAIDTSATITTRVYDRATGAPVQGVCVFANPLRRFSMPDVCQHRTSAEGKVHVGVPEPGTYNLFALPDVGSAYGAQWVGSVGGVGTQESAKRNTVAIGETVAAPTILLDPPATITGRLPIYRKPGAVSIVAPEPGETRPARWSPISTVGTFGITGLGPYGWPLLFMVDGYPPQWSGRFGNRLRADPAWAVDGSVTPPLFSLEGGTPITVRVEGEPPARFGRLVFRNADSGEQIGVGYLSPQGETTTLIAGGQLVKMQCFCASGVRWDRGVDFDSTIAHRVPTVGSHHWVFRGGTEARPGAGSGR